jgi:hypothetical protein
MLTFKNYPLEITTCFGRIRSPSVTHIQVVQQRTNIHTKWGTQKQDNNTTPTPVRAT